MNEGASTTRRRPGARRCGDDRRRAGHCDHVNTGVRGRLRAGGGLHRRPGRASVMRLSLILALVVVLAWPMPAAAQHSCHTISFLYRYYLNKARACTSYLGQCTYRTRTTPVRAGACAGCPTYVNPANEDAMAGMAAAQAEWDAQNCDDQISCGASQCPVVLGAVCSRGACVDGPPFPPPDPDPVAVEIELPDAPYLAQNWPNPFTGETRIVFTIPRGEGGRMRSSLRIYAVTGSLVHTLIDGWLVPGVQAVDWDGRTDDGRRAASGIYYCRLRVGDQVMTRHMLKLK